MKKEKLLLVVSGIFALDFPFHLPKDEYGSKVEKVYRGLGWGIWRGQGKVKEMGKEGKGHT